MGAVLAIVGALAAWHLAQQSVLLAAVLLGVQVLAFLLYAADKTAAQQGGGRVPEAVLHLLALAGGAPGCFLGRHCFHHKTRKAHFGLFIGAGQFALLAAGLAWSGLSSAVAP